MSVTEAEGNISEWSQGFKDGMGVGGRIVFEAIFSKMSRI
jgi:hypothetical protein